MPGGRMRARFPGIQAFNELDRLLQIAQMLDQAIMTFDVLPDRFGHGTGDQLHEIRHGFQAQTP